MEYTPNRWDFTEEQKAQILAIDSRLEPKLWNLADAIDCFTDDSVAARVERFKNKAIWAGLNDWRGQRIEDPGQPSDFEPVALAAESLIAAITKLTPSAQDQFAGLLDPYGHPTIEGSHERSDISPGLRAYVAIADRIAREANYLAQTASPGRPPKYDGLIGTIILVCHATGIIGTQDEVPTGSKGTIGKLLSLCLEIAGVADEDQPDHGKAIRAYLIREDRDQGRANQEYAEWEEEVRKNRA